MTEHEPDCANMTSSAPCDCDLPATLRERARIRQIIERFERPMVLINRADLLAALDELPCEGCPDPGMPCLGCPALDEGADDE